MHLTFHKKSEEKLQLFFLHYFTVLLFCSLIWEFSEDDMGILGSKMTFYLSCLSFEKSQCKILRHSNHGDISPLFKRKNTTTTKQFKNRLNSLLHTYTHFSNDYLLPLMTIHNFRCLYNILHHLEEHFTHFSNFRYIVVYIY